MSESDGTPAGNPALELALRYGRPHAGYLATGTVTSVLGRVPELLPGLIIGVALDAILLGNRAYQLPLVPDAWIPTGQFDQLLVTVGMLAVLYPLNTALGAVSKWTLRVFSERFQHDVRTDTYDVVQRLETNFFESRETGQIMSVLNDDVRQLGSVVGALVQLVNLVTLAAVVYLFLFWLNWQLATFMFLVPLTLAALSFWLSSVIEPKHLSVRESVGSINERLNNNIEGISVIKSYGTEDHELERLAAASREHYDARWGLLTAKNRFRPTMETVAGLGNGLLLLVGGYWVLVGPPLFFSGVLTAGSLYTFFDYTGRFVEPLRWLPRIVDSYQGGKAASTRIMELDDEETVSEPPDAVELDDVDGTVSYEGVSFTYPGTSETVLEDVSFDVEAGETVGIVGSTGAGKSTLVKLLLRFYDPDRGRVRVDGWDLRDVTLESLRETIGYVSQDPFLFSGSVRDNVSYGRPSLDESAVVQSAKLAGAHEFVRELPDGYDTVVGERGVKLSGGQRQRIALARALANEPPILVLDEATSHVDNETEVVIQRALDRVSERRTTFHVAHRLSTVREADTILVVDDGRIAERGTHEELLEEDGLYANLWRVQVGDVESLPESYLNRLRRQEASQ